MPASTNGGKSKGIRDKIFCKAIRFVGKEDFVLISCDAFLFDRDFVDSSKETAAHNLGVKPEQVALIATHAVSAPAVLLSRKETANSDYASYVHQRVQEAVEGLASPQKASLYFKGARAPGLALNAIYPEKKADDSVFAVHIKTSTNRISLINFSCHPFASGLENDFISGDYPSYIYKEYEGTQGEEALFLNGASGEIYPLSLEYPERTDSFSRSEKIGKILAECTFPDGDQVNPVVVSESVKLNLPLEKFYGGIENARASPESFRGSGALDRAEYLEEEWLKKLNENRTGFVQSEVQVLALSNQVTIVGFQGELFSSLGETVQLGSPFANTLIANNSNGWLGHIPDRKIYESKDELRAYRGAILPLNKESGKMIVKAMLKALSSVSEKMQR